MKMKGRKEYLMELMRDIVYPNLLEFMISIGRSEIVIIYSGCKNIKIDSTGAVYIFEENKEANGWNWSPRPHTNTGWVPVLKTSEQTAGWCDEVMNSLDRLIKKANAFETTIRRAESIQVVKERKVITEKTLHIYMKHIT